MVLSAPVFLVFPYIFHTLTIFVSYYFPLIMLIIGLSGLLVLIFFF